MMKLGERGIRVKMKVAALIVMAAFFSVRPLVHSENNFFEITYVDDEKMTDRLILDFETKNKIEKTLLKIFSFYSDHLELPYGYKLELKMRIFQTREAFDAYREEATSLKRVSGYYSPKLKELVLWSHDRPERMLEVINHEASHAFVREIMAWCPKWLNEGLAEYFEHMKFENYLLRVYTDIPDDARVKEWLLKDELVSIKSYVEMPNKEWVAMHESGSKSPYTVAWALSAFLMSNDSGKQVIKQSIYSIVNEDRRNFSFVELVNRIYPGGLYMLERQWHEWIGEERRSQIFL